MKECTCCDGRGVVRVADAPLSYEDCGGWPPPDPEQDCAECHGTGAVPFRAPCRVERNRAGPGWRIVDADGDLVAIVPDAVLACALSDVLEDGSADIAARVHRIINERSEQDGGMDEPPSAWLGVAR